jgi:uncharacterized protein (TIGR03084 family)
VFEQPADFRDESEALYRLLADFEDADFDRPTRFKQWTINDILLHLHTWNWGLEQALVNEQGFKDFFADFLAEPTPQSMHVCEKQLAGSLHGNALLEAWRRQYIKSAEEFERADPKRRVPWAGPDMSVRSGVSARMMETWAHGQAIYDLLGVERIDTDRIRNIAVLGVNTFRWTFVTHKQTAPTITPHVRLVAPSGAIWTFNAASDDDLVEGNATEFCQVVTQVRNIADTRLRVVGDAATRWMSIAQCFAGPPETPPAPGTRFREDRSERNT